MIPTVWGVFWSPEHQVAHPGGVDKLARGQGATGPLQVHAMFKYACTCKCTACAAYATKRAPARMSVRASGFSTHPTHGAACIRVCMHTAKAPCHPSGSQPRHHVRTPTGVRKQSGDQCAGIQRQRTRTSTNKAQYNHYGNDVKREKREPCRITSHMTVCVALPS